MIHLGSEKCKKSEKEKLEGITLFLLDIYVYGCLRVVL